VHIDGPIRTAPQVATGDDLGAVNDRRLFLAGLSASAAATLLPDRAHAAKKGRFGIAYTSFAVRMLQGRDLIRGTAPGAPAFPAESFIDLCRSFGADGCQMDVTQLPSRDPATLDGLKRRLAEGGLFLELSVDGRSLEDADRFAELAGLARALGAVRLRVALLHGRRYEDFRTREAWQEFASHWQRVLPRAKGFLEAHRLPVGLENHKDFRIVELVDLIRSVDSPWLGACVDFGNNLAFLEDPLELAEALAPYAITTHLKDMAVRPYADGFELSEVPLGEGLLPLPAMVAALRKHRPDLPLCLEMITRDPLKVPYLQDSYWVPFGARDEALVERFRTKVLSRASAAPLPRITGLSAVQQLAAEDENVRRCAAYARAHLEG
jgi:sugar phosphate isomerase/epimerase